MFQAAVQYGTEVNLITLAGQLCGGGILCPYSEPKLELFRKVIFLEFSFCSVQGVVFTRVLPNRTLNHQFKMFKEKYWSRRKYYSRQPQEVSTYYRKCCKYGKYVVKSNLCNRWKHWPFLQRSSSAFRVLHFDICNLYFRLSLPMVSFDIYVYFHSFKMT